MVDAVTSQTLLDNKTRLIMKFTNISDGTGESAVTVKFTINGEEVTSFTIASPIDVTYPYYVRNVDGSLAVFGEGVKEFAQLHAA